MRLCILLAILATIACAASPPASSGSLRLHIRTTIANTHYRQTVMGARLTPTRGEYLHRRGGMLRYIAHRWDLIAAGVWTAFEHPPHEGAWACIHRYEGSWSDRGDPYWGGLQMDRGFQSSYAPWLLLRRGWANRWTPLEQMWVAERAHRSRGYWPWPNTARYCGLI